MLKYFKSQWDTVPFTVIDTETTGIDPAVDKIVQIAVVRFENYEPVASLSSLINPNRDIPKEASAVHGVLNEHVVGAPQIKDFFYSKEVQNLLTDAQPAAYNAQFDKQFVPPFGSDWTWPWFDPMNLIRYRDRYVPGKGRHRLEATCKRYGIELINAHSAIGDATATGKLLFLVGKQTFPKQYSLGKALDWLNRVQAAEWFRHHQWRCGLPPKEENEEIRNQSDEKSDRQEAS